MRVMISQPMNGLTREQIEENRANAVKTIESYGYTVVDSFVTDSTPKTNNDALYYLGKSLEIMATCHAVYFVKGWEKARGCRIERAACKAYGLKIMGADDPDEIECKLHSDSKFTLEQLIAAKQKAASYGKKLVFVGVTRLGTEGPNPNDIICARETIKYLNMDLPRLLEAENQRRDPVAELLGRPDLQGEEYSLRNFVQKEDFQKQFLQKS